MKLFFDFLKSKKIVLLFFAVVFILFAVSFYLYKLPVKAVIYPFFVSVTAGIVFLIFEFFKFKKKHSDLQYIKKVSYQTADLNYLKKYANGKIENDYIEIAELFKKEIEDLKINADKKYNKTVDYYTVWVHQIKTPIAAMKLNLQNEDSEFSRELQTNLFKIEQYAEMVLTYWRLNSNETDYVFSEFEIDGLIKQAIKKFSMEFINRKIALQYEEISKDIKTVTDEKWFLFVLEQIISNALKYTNEGSISIFYLKDENTLCIKDTGIGISKEDLPRIFESGFTGNNGRYDKKATGIGLYLVKKICKNLNIKISAESELNKGTTIKLKLT